MRTRYPGTVPFTSAQADRFFGRETEIQDLQRLIDLRRMGVLHGRSGLGKSSLLGAGLIPRLQAEGTTCIRIRLGSHQGPNSPLPTATLAKALQDVALGSEMTAPIDSDAPSLWQLGKYIQHEALQAGIAQPRLLLIFDQFEELFTYPDGGKRFAHTLGELLSNQMPRSFRLGLEQAIEAGNAWPNDEELAFWERPLDVKALIAIRSDRMSLLDQLSDELPYVLNHRYELQPLQAAGARAAIATPAGLSGDFSSPAFQYQEAALTAMLTALQDEAGTVEPFQLQILCQHLEQTLSARPDTLQPVPNDLPQLPAAALPDTEQLFRDYYETALGQIEPEADRQRAQKLIENGLLLADEERRLTLDQAQIQATYAVSPALLQRLVDIRLLRAEPNRMGGLSYELSHDTLIPSILQTREEREAEEHLQQEKEAAKAQLQGRLRRLGLVGLILFLFLLVTGVLAFLLYRQNQELQAVSNQILRAYRELGAFVKIDEDASTDQPEDVFEQVLDLTNELDRAKQALVKARVQAFQAETRKLDSVLDKGDLAPEELKAFIESYQATVDSLLEDEVIAVTPDSVEVQRLQALPPNQKAREIDARLEEAQRLLAQGNPSAAIKKYQSILLLDPENREALDALAELTGQSAESDNSDAPQGMARGALPDTSALADTSAHAEEEAVEEEQQPVVAEEIPLPRMVQIPGGTFEMGSEKGENDEKPVHTVTVSTFYLAETEVAFAQYDYFCEQTGRPKPDDAGWGRGDRPVKQVSWNDAQAYCRWVSSQTGQTYRLPTEAEWEYAAGGGTSGRTTYIGTNSTGNLKDYVIYSGKRSGSQTSPVKSKRPNRLGLYDMGGNVEEWCQDWYASTYYASSPENNPTGPSRGSKRVLRGGSWFRDPSTSGAADLRVARRAKQSPSYADPEAGFRLARTPAFKTALDQVLAIADTTERLNALQALQTQYPAQQLRLEQEIITLQNALTPPTPEPTTLKSPSPA